MIDVDQFDEFMADGDVPVNLPPAADAWEDMRKRLEDEMPKAGVPFPDNVVTINTPILQGFAVLFILLMILTNIWWLGSTGASHKTAIKNNGSTQPNKVLNNLENGGHDKGYKTLTQKDSLLNINKQEPVLAKPIAANKGRHTNMALQNGSPETKAGDENKSLHIVDTPAIHSSKKTETELLVSAWENVTNNNKKRGPKAGEDKDSSAQEAVKDSATENSKSHLQVGLQWNVQLPFSGTQGYFAGTNGKAQPYLIALPAVWLGIQSEKSIYLVEVNPFATTVLRSKTVTTTISQPTPQSLLTQTKKLNKLFGMYAAFKYDYNLSGNWWAGAGVQAGLWNKGAATIYSEYDNGASKTYATTSSGINDTDRANFNKFQFNLNAELMYKSANWQAGLSAGAYFTPLGKAYGGPKNPLQVQLFFRQALIGIVKKKK